MIGKFEDPYPLPSSEKERLNKVEFEYMTDTRGMKGLNYKGQYNIYGGEYNIKAGRWIAVVFITALGSKIIEWTVGGFP